MSEIAVEPLYELPADGSDADLKIRAMLEDSKGLLVVYTTERAHRVISCVGDYDAKEDFRCFPVADGRLASRFVRKYGSGTVHFINVPSEESMQAGAGAMFGKGAPELTVLKRAALTPPTRTPAF